MGNHSGAAHYKYDEEVPQVYEQVSDITALVTAARTSWITTT